MTYLTFSRKFSKTICWSSFSLESAFPHRVPRISFRMIEQFHLPTDYKNLW